MNEHILQRYEQAQTIMQGFANSRVAMNDAVFPHWINDTDSFWYKRETRQGVEYRLVNASCASNVIAFDHSALAKSLGRSMGESIDPANLPIKHVTLNLSPLQVRFQAFRKHWLFDESSGSCTEEKTKVFPLDLCSPDGKSAVFVRNHNLWLRDIETGTERALTEDGVEDYCYACSVDIDFVPEVQAQWSPDSQRLFTVRRDTRKVASRPYVLYAPQDGSLQPQLVQVKRAYPGDEYLENLCLVVIDINSGELLEADYPPIPPSGYGFGFFHGKALGWWASDSRRCFFVDVARGAKKVQVVEFDADTGFTRVLFEESSDTFVRLTHGFENIPHLYPLPESDELIWFSERTGWGQLYLYDLKTGELKQPITSGEWMVRDVLFFDAKKREVLIQTAARDPKINPYYRDICKVNVDTCELTALVSGNYEHLVYQPYSIQTFGLVENNTSVDGVSPDGNYIVTTRSRVDMAPISLLIDRAGKEVLTLEVADVSGLPEGWQWPEPVKLKGSDNQTDIYGVIYRPPGFSPDKQYPVLDFSCGVRHYESVPQGAFVNGPNYGYNYLAGAALAALGFIVVAIEGRGTTNRDKAFQDYHYGDPSCDSDFNDRISGIRQLSTLYPYMDLERVGLTNLDGQNNPIYGLINHPDFYKVGVIHQYIDSRFWHAAQAEIWGGVSPDRSGASSPHLALDHVDSLKCKLLLIQGMLDYATPASTFQLVEALQKANKDFDMLCLPNLPHGIVSYTLRRNWDYLVKHLQGVEPPKEFHLTTGQDALI